MRPLWPLLAAGAALGAVVLLSSSASEAAPTPPPAGSGPIKPKDAFFVTFERSTAIARELGADPPTNPVRLRAVTVSPNGEIVAEVADVAQLQGQTGKRVTVHTSDVLARSP